MYIYIYIYYIYIYYIHIYIYIYESKYRRNNEHPTNGKFTATSAT